MSVLSKLGDIRKSLFTRVYGIVVDITTGTVGVKPGNADDDDNDRTYTLTKGANGKFKAVKQPPAFGVDIPAFAIRTPVDKLKPGDIITTDDDGWVFYIGEAKDAADLDNPTIRVLDPNTNKTSDLAVPVEPLLGGAGVLAVQTAFLQGNNLLLLSLLGDEDDSKPKHPGVEKNGRLDDLLPLLLLQQNGGAGGLLGGEGGLGGFLPLLLLGKGKTDDLLPLLLLQQNGGGGLLGGEGGLGGLLPLLLLNK